VTHSGKVILATQEAGIRRITVRSQPWANSLRGPILKNPSQKRAGGVAQGVGPEFKPQYCQKKKKLMGSNVNLIIMIVN
jgi:hypothetical protein